MLYDMVRRTIKKPLHILGLDLVRRNDANSKPDEIPLLDDPLEALCYEKAGERVAFMCPLENVIDIRGHGYVPGKWHPFVETLREYNADQCSSYKDSLLKAYYDTHQPKNAADAYPGFEDAPASFRDWPPHRYRLLPWSANTPEDVDERVRYWTHRDNEEHGFSDLTFSSDGNKSHGPVSTRKGQMEFERLTSIFESIKSKGYDTNLGYPHFRILKRRGEYVLNPVRGKHRTAAAAALGFEKIPALYYRPSIVDISMVKYWPQVRRGVWSQEQAKSYFRHLFRFDSLDWARKRNLLAGQ